MENSLPFYQIDAFASRPFEGNQACVMPLDAFLPDPVLQAIAAENNVAETAYIAPTAEGVWDLRWFTPATEVPLCGHATLASAHALFEHLGFGGDEIAFDTRKAGRLTVKRLADGRLEMDFPVSDVRASEPSAELIEALGATPARVWTGGYVAALFDDPDAVRALQPDFQKLAKIEGAQLEPGCVGCLAPGGPDGAAVTSRFFAPGVGLPEDPATGSWHCMVAPVMAEELGETTFECFQAYHGRGARLRVALAGSRVKLRGSSVTVIEGRFRL